MSCPILPAFLDDSISLAHGEGMRLTRDLIRKHIQPQLHIDSGSAFSDAACIGPVDGRLAMTTDSFVVSPLVFPGGDIGKLAVFGALNDLVVTGAAPRWMSLALILEEGLKIAFLNQILGSMGDALREAGVRAICGDTKVVPRGACDGLYVNTTGIGLMVDPTPPGPAHLQVGDQVIVSGPIGQHGFAILNAREQLGLMGEIRSDCGYLGPAVDALRHAGIPIRAMRDATRGGVGGVLHEWAMDCKLTFRIDATKVPMHDAIRGASEILGLDPLFVANEGTMVIAVPADFTQSAIDALRSTRIGREANCIGEVVGRTVCPVVIRRALGRDVPLDEPSGAMLPRIC